MLRKWIVEFASNLRYPTLVGIFGVLFLLDLFIPDFIPFVDEILLGLLTVLMGTLKKRKVKPVEQIEVDDENLPERGDPDED